MREEAYLALEASAGSGKTFALSVRYLSLLFLGANPQKIVALTFTNKSAAEMRERIFETLKHLEEKEELKEIAKQTQMSIETLLAHKKQIMSTFLQSDIKITTLDSFFGTLLRRFSLHVGIQPDFQVEYTRDQEALLERFIKACKKARMYQALVALSVGEEKKLSDIMQLLEVLYQKKGEYDISLLPMAPFASPKASFDILARIKVLFENLGLGERGLKTFEASSFSELLAKKFLEKEDFSYWDYKKYANEETNRLHGELKNALKMECEAKEAYFLGTLGKLFSLYCQTLKGLCVEKGELHFSDVTNLLHTLLRDEIRKDFLYFRLDGVIEHLLIDEFQDTSVVQYQILLPLIEEIRSGIGTKAFKTLFFVGDIKQSIYRFRGGAKTLFGYAKNTLQLKVESLDTNYRSCKEVVSFVNEMFNERISGYEWQNVPSHKDEGYVRVRQDESIEALVLESIEQFLEKGISPKNIALLVHTNKDAKAMQELIVEHFPSLHVRLEARLKLTDVPCIRALISLLKYFYFKEALYRAEFLVLQGRSWNEALDAYHCDMGQTPLVILQKMISHFGLFDNSADMLFLIEIASRYEDIESFLFDLEDLSDEAKSEDEEGIRVLTVHKSKGLEFDHVIVCDRFTKENNRSGTILYAYDEVHVEGIYYSMGQREVIDPLYAKAKEKEKILIDEDRLNTLYVAFTRAKRSLCVCAKSKESVFDALVLPVCERGSISKSSDKMAPPLSPLPVYPMKKYGSQEQTTQEERPSEYDIKAISFGVALHYLLEMLDSFNEASLERAFTAVKNRYAPILDASSMDEIYQRGKQLLTCKAFQTLLQGALLFKEQPLLYQNERKQIDLLLQYKDKIIVIDYKSSQKESAKHHAQVSLYKEALSQMYALPVEGYLCYLLSDRIELVKSL